MAEITLGKALKIKNRLTGRLAKVQADIQAYNSVPEGQSGQVNVPALAKTRDELVEALIGLKTTISEARRLYAASGRALRADHRAASTQRPRSCEAGPPFRAMERRPAPRSGW